MSEAEEIHKRIGKMIDSVQKWIKIPNWYEFENHILLHNRLCNSKCKEEIGIFLDDILLSNNYTITLPKGTTLYRARMIKNNEFNSDEKNSDNTIKGFDEKGSGKPPALIADNGRVNPIGISILYTATEVETACAEIRPFKNCYLSVAQFKLNDDILLADFVLDKVAQNENDPQKIFFLNDMFKCFSIPVTNGLIEYLPSQFIAEYIRINHKKIAGIRYSSLQNEGGYNVALFNDKVCSFIQSQVFECDRVEYDYSALYNEKSAEQS